jgi:hypothetical protein
MKLLPLFPLILILSGCAHLEPANANLKPIVLQRAETRNIIVGLATPGTITLPAGTYESDFQTREGVYYRPSKSLIQKAVGITEVMQGGLFIPHPDARDQRQGYWADATSRDSLATMGTRNATRVHRFDKAVEYEFAPASNR